MAGIGNVIKSIMRYKGLRQYQLAAVTGKAPNTLSKILSDGNLGVKEAAALLDILGYELVIQKKRTGPKRADEINITIGESDQKEAYNYIAPRLEAMDKRQINND